MKLTEIRKQLTSLLEEMAEKAKRDARNGEVDLSDILGFGVDDDEIKLLDEVEVAATVDAINKLTRTKAGARRLVAAITLAVKHAGKLL